LWGRLVACGGLLIRLPELWHAPARATPQTPAHSARVDRTAGAAFLTRVTKLQGGRADQQVTKRNPRANCLYVTTDSAASVSPIAAAISPIAW